MKRKTQRKKQKPHCKKESNSYYRFLNFCHFLHISYLLEQAWEFWNQNLNELPHIHVNLLTKEYKKSTKQVIKSNKKRTDSVFFTFVRWFSFWTIVSPNTDSASWEIRLNLSGPVVAVIFFSLFMATKSLFFLSFSGVDATIASTSMVLFAKCFLTGLVSAEDIPLWSVEDNPSWAVPYDVRVTFAPPFVRTLKFWKLQIVPYI